MSQRVILVHGWDGSPENAWFPWLKDELEQRGYEVFVPAMPDPEHPEPVAWVSQLENIVGSVDVDTHFVGHSIGCQAIMRFLAENIGNVGMVVLVAGFFELVDLETQEEKEIWQRWADRPFDASKLSEQTKQVVAILSDDDSDVVLAPSKEKFEAIGAKVIVESGMGHFDDSRGIKELPSVLKEFDYV